MEARWDLLILHPDDEGIEVIDPLRFVRHHTSTIV